jgi:radical SAM superfamily enzyme YgiQ (UPF0313 family)
LRALEYGKKLFKIDEQMFHGIIFSYRKDRVDRGTGAHRIASFLREAGWDVEVVDFCSEWTLEELKELVKSRVSSRTKFFGFSSFINWWPRDTNLFTGWLKKQWPDIATILGGQGALLTPAENIDYWVDSFGELAMLELCKYISGKTIFNSGLVFEDYEGKKVIRALKTFPAWKLPTFRNKHESRDFLKPYEMLTIETSRGCKFKCSFCNFPILGVKEDTSRSADDLAEELRYNYNEYGIKNYTIADETFNDRSEKIFKYADMIQGLNFDPWFMAFLRADLMISNRNTWDAIRDMGCGGHFYGIETFNHAAGKIIGKGMHPDKLKQGLIEFRNFLEPEGIYRGTVSLICGLPKETPETFMDGIDWCIKNWGGQSLASWYLEIPEYNTPMTNLSEFSKNLERYGLRKKRIDAESVQKPSITSFFPSLKDITIWEHDDMDEIQAIDIMKNLYDNIWKKNWFCSGFSCTTGLVQHQTNNIKEIIDKRSFSDSADNVNNFIDDYKRKKLDWKND